MPLVAHVDCDRIVSTEADEAVWRECRYRSARLQGHGLSLPCCGRRAIPKTSPRGLRYFAHDARKGCASENESLAHLWTKTAVAQTIRERSGWTASVEERASDGSYVADVLARGNGIVLAFEAQLSSLPRETLENRSQRYLADGILPVWLRSGRKPGLAPDYLGAIIYRLSRDDFDGIGPSVASHEPVRQAVHRTIRIVEDAAWICAGADHALRSHGQVENHVTTDLAGIPYRVDAAVGHDGRTVQTIIAADFARTVGSWQGPRSTVVKAPDLPERRRSGMTTAETRMLGPQPLEWPQHAGRTLAFSSPDVWGGVDQGDIHRCPLDCHAQGLADHVAAKVTQALDRDPPRSRSGDRRFRQQLQHLRTRGWTVDELARRFRKPRDEIERILA